eukprot:8950879-Karenia_brevis.AAC.1
MHHIQNKRASSSSCVDHELILASNPPAHQQEVTPNAQWVQAANASILFYSAGQSASPSPARPSTPAGCAC